MLRLSLLRPGKAPMWYGMIKRDSGASLLLRELARNELMSNKLWV